MIVETHKDRKRSKSSSSGASCTILGLQLLSFLTAVWMTRSPRQPAGVELWRVKRVVRWERGPLNRSGSDSQLLCCEKVNVGSYRWWSSGQLNNTGEQPEGGTMRTCDVSAGWCIAQRQDETDCLILLRNWWSHLSAGFISEAVPGQKHVLFHADQQGACTDLIGFNLNRKFPQFDQFLLSG